MKNLIKIFETIPSIPVAFVVDPLIKCIQEGDGTTYFYNTIDFDFFVAVAKHPKLHPRNALQLVDILAKIYLNDLSYATCGGNAFMEISSRFHEDDNVKGKLALLLLFRVHHQVPHSIDLDATYCRKASR